MRCLFVSAGMLFGGAERVTSILANEWGKKGCETRILVTRTEATSRYPLSDKVTIVSCYKDVNRAKIGQVAIIKAVRNICKEWKPDVVISFYNDLCALSALAVTGLHIPLIYSERNDPNKTNQRRSDRLYRKIVEKQANRIVFQTKGAQMCYPKSVQNKSVVILNPLDTVKLPIHDFSHEKKEIVTVGRLEPQKNQKLLITAFSLIVDEFPDYSLVLYGEGSLRKELESYVKEKNLQKSVFLPGAKNNIQEYIKDASIFVLSSDYEGIPNALIEAMAIGLPCVSTDCSPGGARELIKDNENGVVVECGNTNVLAGAMASLLTDKEGAKRLGMNARKISTRVDKSLVCNQWLELIKDCRGKANGD